MSGSVPNDYNSVAKLLFEIARREPDFTIAGIPIFIHPLVAKDQLWMIAGRSAVLVGKGGDWKNFTREEFELKLIGLLSENNSNS